MIQKKVCILGAFAVGKTSLISRFVTSLFSEDYLSTVGVKVDKKVVRVGETDFKLVLWDLAGQDDFYAIRLNYLRGASGYLLVADGTRPTTLTTAMEIQEAAARRYGRLPYVLVLNKADLGNQWGVAEPPANRPPDGACGVLRTSAKTGEGVEEAFSLLAGQFLNDRPGLLASRTEDA